MGGGFLREVCNKNAILRRAFQQIIKIRSRHETEATILAKSPWGTFKKL